MNGDTGVDEYAHVSKVVTYPMLPVTDAPSVVVAVTVSVPLDATTGVPDNVTTDPDTVPVIPGITFEVTVFNNVPAAFENVKSIGVIVRPTTKD